MKQTPFLTKHNHSQQGGTFLGIILGLVIGLGIAVAVALMITKSPIPFTNNKTLRPERAPDPTAEQVTDPNKLLYGNKEVARQAAREQAKANDPAALLPPTAQAPLPVPKVLEKPDEPKNQVSSASAMVGKTELDDKWVYYLQAGAFRAPADAENARAKLALLGFEGRVSERQSENGILYRVRLGPFAQLDAMNRIRAKLQDNSVDAAVVRIPK